MSSNPAFKCLLAFHPERSIWLILVVLFCHADGQAQIGLGGFHAIMTVPTARIQPDGHLAIGFGYIPKPYGALHQPDYDNVPYFATLGFLPFLEVSLRATVPLDEKRSGIGDRMASMRVQLFREQRRRPALAVGLHDLIAIQGRKGWFNALYAVATKTVFVSRQWHVENTIGYGVDWIEANSHEFAGFFGGVSLGYRRLLFIKGEYDAKRLNAGLGLAVKNFLAVNLVLLDGRKFAFGANLQTHF